MRPYPNRFSVCNLLIGLILVLVFTFPINVLAKKCPTPGHPSCDDGGGGGGGTTTTAQDIYGWWSGDLFGAERFCPTTSLNLTNGGTTYECDHGVANPSVAFTFSDGDFLASGRQPELCDMLSEGLVFGDETNRLSAFVVSSHVEWNDDICLDDGSGSTTCRVRIWLASYGELCTQSERDSGACGDRRVTFEGFGPADAATAPELNPFTQAQNFDLNELTVTIKAIGKNRTEATCTADFNLTAVQFNTRLP